MTSVMIYKNIILTHINDLCNDIYEYNINSY